VPGEDEEGDEDGQEDGDEDGEEDGDEDGQEDGDEDGEEDGDEDADPDDDGDGDGEWLAATDPDGEGTGGMAAGVDGLKYADGLWIVDGPIRSLPPDRDPSRVDDAGTGVVAGPAPCAWACAAAGGVCAVPVGGWANVAVEGARPPLMTKTAAAEAARSPGTNTGIRRKKRSRPERPDSGSMADGPTLKAWGGQPDGRLTGPTRVGNSLAVGRAFGFLARQLPTSPRNLAGRVSKRAELLTSRQSSAAFDPEPNGP
jgi:hypothetical protein